MSVTNTLQYRLHLGEQIQQSNLTNSSVEVQEQKGAGRTLNEVRIRKTPQGSSFDIESLQDPLIFPGLYAPSGFDMMGILVSYYAWFFYTLRCIIQCDYVQSVHPSPSSYCSYILVVLVASFIHVAESVVHQEKKVNGLFSPVGSCTNPSKPCNCYRQCRQLCCIGLM